MSSEGIWILAERLPGEHIAQLYSHETVLVESLRMFTTHGLSRGEAVLLVLTPSHRDMLLEHLNADGFDVGQLQQDGQLLLRDAAELLACFMLNGMPDTTLFRMSVGEVVEGMKSKGAKGTVRVFGEMVDLLWKSNSTPTSVFIPFMNAAFAVCCRSCFRKPRTAAAGSVAPAKNVS